MVRLVCSFASISQTELIELGVKDSKDLTKKKREELYQILVEMPHNVIICDPKRIDNSQNLNQLEVELFAESLSIMPEGDIMLDACDVDASRFARNVSAISKRNCYAEHKADENHPEVSAASIIAKVTRDNCVKQLSQELNMDLGSGYPSDPKTKAAVKILSIGEYPHDCLRWSWKTVSDARGSPVPKRPGGPQQTLF